MVLRGSQISYSHILCSSSEETEINLVTYLNLVTFNPQYIPTQVFNSFHKSSILLNKRHFLSKIYNKSNYFSQSFNYWYLSKIITKILSISHKLKFSNPQLFATWWQNYSFIVLKSVFVTKTLNFRRKKFK